jgi:hypothetical protein
VVLLPSWIQVKVISPTFGPGREVTELTLPGVAGAAARAGVDVIMLVITRAAATGNAKRLRGIYGGLPEKRDGWIPSRASRELIEND